MLEKALHKPMRDAFNNLFREDNRHHYHKDSDIVGGYAIRLPYDWFVVDRDWYHIPMEYKMCNNLKTYCFKSIFSNTSWQWEIKALTRLNTRKKLIIIQFSVKRAYIKYYDLQFVLDNFDRNFKIEEGGTVLKKVNWYLDVKSLLYS